MQEDRLDTLLQQMREETVSPGQLAEAKERVWNKIAGPASAACASFLPDFPAYHAGQLAGPRRLLVEDHLSRCASCRRQLAESTGERKVIPLPQARRSRFAGWTKWAVAAGVAAAALYLGADRIDTALAPSGPRATVASTSGQLYLVSGGALAKGAEIGEGQLVRTAAGSRAVLRLADGSLMEMNERTELAIHSAWSGQTVALGTGDLVIEAAKQRNGRLRVRTRDSLASVKGTVFAVSSGAAGSLVAVVEGSVEVSQPGATKLLSAGQIASTDSRLESVSARNAVSWSSNADKYYALLAEFMQIEKQLAALPAPALRTQSALLRQLPEGAFVYAAIPNLNGTIREALRMIDSRAQDSPVLKEWWTSRSGQEAKKLFEGLQDVTPLLGDELVMTAVHLPGGRQIPAFLATVQPGRRANLDQALQRLQQSSQETFPYRLTEDLLLISHSAPNLASIAALLGRGTATPFAAEIQSRYSRGVGWMLGLDIQAIGLSPNAASEVSLLGFSNMKHLFFEWRNVHGADDNRASLTFSGARTGLASWLATPGPAASAEYISAEAAAVLSASTRDPRQAFTELLASLGNLAGGISQFEQKSGISIASDIAPAFGTNFTLAMERPAIPLPGWVAALEVHHPAMLDAAVRRLADSFNREAANSGIQVSYSTETVNGRIWMSLKTNSSPITLFWTYDRGYMIASTDRALAARAITVRDTGPQLVRSARFRSQQPSTGGLHYSGFFWLNTEGAIADVAAFFTSGALKNLLANREPTLVVFDGETERIHAASRTRLTSLIMDLMLFAGPDIHPSTAAAGKAAGARVQKSVAKRVRKR
ncbi:MAG: hypothetical protein FJW20_10030 [Acidimicrobiia bacterium]|nr:hypothetical protein [Acidimicrobiia bacterium]